MPALFLLWEPLDQPLIPPSEPGAGTEENHENADDAEGVEMQDQRTERDTDGHEIDHEGPESGGDGGGEELTRRALREEAHGQLCQESAEDEPEYERQKQASHPPAGNIHRIPQPESVNGSQRWRSTA